MSFKKNVRKLIVPALAALALVAAFFLGGGIPDTAARETAGPTASAAPTSVVTPAPTPAPTPTPTPTPAPAPTPTTTPAPAEDVVTELACTVSVSCATILDNMELCDPDKAELVPSDGWILAPTEVVFYEGESVFNVLQRVCKQLGIHMEFESTPISDSAYIEGVGNIYEFDAGELSGWTYSVNGVFPNYSCSLYALSDGDVICWRYTCDLGLDVGGRMQSAE